MTFWIVEVIVGSVTVEGNWRVAGMLDDSVVITPIFARLSSMLWLAQTGSVGFLVSLKSVGVNRTRDGFSTVDMIGGCASTELVSLVSAILKAVMAW